MFLSKGTASAKGKKKKHICKGFTNISIFVIYIVVEEKIGDEVEKINSKIMKNLKGHVKELDFILRTVGCTRVLIT